MDWNDIQSQWQGHASEPAKATRPKAAERLRRQVQRRDFLETALALLMLPVFGAGAWFAAVKGNWAAFGFLLLIVLAMIGIPWQLWRVRRMGPPADHQYSVLEFLHAERRALQAQAAQLRYAWLWYFLPIGIGVTGMQFALQGINRATVSYAVLVIVLGIAIDILNRLYAAPKFQRMADAIEQQIQELEENT
jgi:membrane protein YdbS with pleckstrin-like domain